MFSTILSGTIVGMESRLVEVEVDLSAGLPCFVMVGKLGAEVKESGERVRIALKNAGIIIPPMHISINLSPAGFRKEGTGFDLPIAVGVLDALGRLPAGCGKDMLILGELGLNGEIRQTKGVLPLAVSAVKAGIRQCLVPVQNAKEAAAAKGMKSVGVSHLGQVMAYLKLSGEKRDMLIRPEKEEPESLLQESRQKEEEEERLDFADIMGQESVKRAALIAAAGFHHMLITGPPGAGKTMIARRMSTILPPLTLEESLEVSSVYSIAGRLPAEKGLITRRPFLSPHHTVTPAALSGGGRIPGPGIISLSHRGILFLDELPEFKRQTLDLLRQPLEDKEIQIARSSGCFTYPADMMLVAAMNPCPCGYYPDTGRCRCTPFEIHSYTGHISGPVLDRIDIHAEASPIEVSQLQSGKRGISSAFMRERVMKARDRQEKRYAGTSFRFNSDLKPGDMEKYCPLGEGEKELMEKMFHTMHLSARAYHRVLKVARTIADLEGSRRIEAKHLREAVCYRAVEQGGYGDDK
ncbi:MAG: YifB family Mg chelatase-like AAA ATPase [Lachnospiraceae bacterium]|nr:YifB family Mg chelatase-like AAA ATPase [Lachnospiraceae bacterium]